MTDEQPKKERKKGERPPTDVVIQAAGRCWRLMDKLSPAERLSVARFLMDRSLAGAQQVALVGQQNAPGVPQRPPGGTLFDL